MNEVRRESARRSGAGGDRGWARRAGSRLLLTVALAVALGTLISASPASATVAGDPGWSVPVVFQPSSGAVAYTPTWPCTGVCVYSGLTTHFTAAMGAGVTIAPPGVAPTIRLGAGGSVIGTCTVSTTTLDCQATGQFFAFAPSFATLSSPLSLEVPVATPSGSVLATLGWSDPGSATTNDPGNDSQTLVLATAAAGDWGYASAGAAESPGTYTDQLRWTCLARACIYAPSTRFTVTLRNGATLVDPVGSTRNLASPTIIGTCTVVSATSLVCTPAAAGSLATGGELAAPEVQYTIPASAPVGQPVVVLSWSDPGAGGNDPSNDTYTVRVGDGVREPSLVFGEGFENGRELSPTLISGYVGAGPLAQTYTADTPWLTNCNGIIAAQENPVGSLPGAVSNCAQNPPTNPDGAFSGVKSLAWALGTLDVTGNGNSDPVGNHALSAYTSANPGAPFVQLQTVKPIPVTPGRFYSLGIESAAQNCIGNAQPLLVFNLLDGATAHSVSSAPTNPCADPQEIITSPSDGEVNWVARQVAPTPLLFMGSSLGVQLVNNQPSGAGNDAAVDNLRLLDVSPSLEKTFSPSTIPVGGVSTATFTVTNTTELAAKAGWSFTDTLPTGVEIAAAPAAATTCANGSVTAAAGGGSVSAAGDLNAGQSSCAITVAVMSSVAGVHTNRDYALVGLVTPSPTALTVAAPAPTVTPPPVTTPPVVTVPAGGSADLALVKRASTTSVGPGGQVLYTLLVANHGPGAVTGVRVSDPLPAGLTAVSARPSQGSCSTSGGTVACALGTIVDGGSAQVLVSANVAGSARGTLVNTATVAAVEKDPKPANNGSTSRVRVKAAKQPRANLKITKRVNHKSGRVGEALSYTVVVSNRGPKTATDVHVIDALSAPVRLLSVKTTAGKCRRAQPFGCSLGSIKAGHRVTITVVARPRVSGSLRNSASVTGSGVDARTANNLVVVRSRVAGARAAVRLTKLATPTRARSGSRVTFRITVRSVGGLTARKVRVCDALPSPLRPIRARGAKRVAGSLCWTVASLKPGKHRTFTIAVAVPHVDRSRTITNTASATGTGLRRVTAHAKVHVLAAAVTPSFTGRWSH